MKNLLGRGGEMLLIHGYREFFTEPERIETSVQLIGFQGITEHILVETGSIRFRLFRHDDQEINEQVYQAFLNLIHEIGLKHPEPVFYSSKMNLYRLNGVLV